MKNRATQFIRELLKSKKITYSRVSKLMREKGYDYSDNTIRTKVSRGSYSFIFLLELCDSLDVDITHINK